MGPIGGFSLAAVVLLSLVLPLTANARLRGASGRPPALRTVWVGQLLGAVGGLWIIVAPVHPEYGVVAAVMACLACLLVLRRQVRTSRIGQTDTP
jgi:hypothetical protein